LDARAGNWRAGNEQENLQHQKLALKKRPTSGIFASRSVSEKCQKKESGRQETASSPRPSPPEEEREKISQTRCRLSHDSSAPGALSFPIVAGLRIFFSRKLSRSFEKCRVGVERLPLIAILRTGIAHALLPLVTAQRQRGRLH